ncbi:MAG: hypothetical protein IJI56_05630 [Firmicutes bacterium]|nr:hypothetical protein [Bacillota bacterium]
MTKLELQYFMDYEDAKMGRFETTGDDGGVPLNILIDNYSEEFPSEGECFIDIYSLGYHIEVFKTEEEFDAAHSDFRMAVPSMIPIGTFSSQEDGSGQDPRILFTGKIFDFEKDPEATGDDPNTLIHLDSYGFDFHLYTKYDGELEAGDIVHGVAWIYGDLIFQNKEEDKDNV